MARNCEKYTNLLQERSTTQYMIKNLTMKQDQSKQKIKDIESNTQKKTALDSTKSEVEQKKFQLSQYDQFGTSPSFNWNSDDTYKTKTGTCFTMIYYGILVYLLFLSIMQFVALDSPSVSYYYYRQEVLQSDSYNLITESFPIIKMREYPHPSDRTN